MNERGKRKRRTRLVLDKVEDNGEDGGDYQQEVSWLYAYSQVP